MDNVKAECSSCSATGIYSGMCEAKGTAVICITCNGTGCETIRYTPFVKRRGRRGIKTVSFSVAGRAALAWRGDGAVGRSISYSEFKKGVRP